ncbi:MAG: hypothetical protein Q7T13_01660 [Polaromonas sp.]|nr:hypothetical protein [Polaromonas sp.]
MQFHELNELPAIANSELVALGIPYRLTLTEYQALPVSLETLKVRALIYDLEAALHNAAPGTQIHEDTLTPIHRFSKGIYTRELTMPAGTVIVGKRHAQEHLVMMTEGYCTVFTERGQEDLTAPCTFISPAGEKRVLIVHEQTTWTTIHRTDATDLQEVEADLILRESPHKELNICTNQGADE